MEMERAVNQAAEQWGRLDIVVANAGLNGVWASLEDLTPEEWDFTLRVNLTGTFLTVKYAVPHLKERGGAVVVVASVNGTRIFGNTGATAYSCAKGGQVIFTKMVALELARYGIRVNAVCPGAIATNIRTRTTLRNVEAIRVPVEYPEGWHPLRGDIGDPDDVAKAILFLASDAASHISGVEIYVDGAESLLRG
jgi:NAD(P)-dependent dehydrogenase (short-subunit alcohol dehydrogenase family)